MKIGNWSEDLELEHLKLKDYLSKKADGALLVNAKSKKYGGFCCSTCVGYVVAE